MLEIRFLVVEKSRGLQRFLRQLLEDFSFNPERIKTTDTPESAIQIAKTLKPDFLLTDWFTQAPMDGIALFHQVQSFNPHCQFALLSSDVGPERAELANTAGALFLQATPCSAAELKLALGQALKSLASKNPNADAHVQANTIAAARHLAALKAAAHLPTFAPGEKILYKGRHDCVKHVILRRGEMVVRLNSDDSLVPAMDVIKV